MSKISTTLAISLMVVTSVLGWVAGYASTTDYKVSMYDKTTMDLGRPDRTLDLRYINAMIAHHRGAMLFGYTSKYTDTATRNERPFRNDSSR